MSGGDRRCARAAALGSLLAAGAPAPLPAQMATAERVEGPGWWPTKGTSAKTEYVGAESCALCHAPQAATQPLTAMARTARRAGESEVLRARGALTFQVGPYSYEIATAGGRSVYSVNDGLRSLSAHLGWAFGVGKVGQSYVFERNGGLHEARVSYYESLQALDFTPRRALASPRDVEEAMARPVSEAEVRRCFGCHTTAAITQGSFNAAGLTPGVTCEACHGPGQRHVAAMAQGRLDEGRAAILNPRRLGAADSVDFCGACHATSWDVTLAGEKGVAALRSQPFRLQGSRCWGEGDARIRCVSCHDPHLPLVRDAGSYDARCLSCHVSAGPPPTRERSAPACKVAAEGCVTCHMPRYEVPEMHSRFTDHQIRVVERARPDSGAKKP